MWNFDKTVKVSILGLGILLCGLSGCNTQGENNMGTKETHNEFDVNKPLTNPVLSDMFKKLEIVNPQDNEAVNESLEEIAKEIALNAKFLSIVKIEGEKPEPGLGSFKKGTKISFIYFTTGDNRQFLPLFTDWDELRKSEEYRSAFVETMVLSFDDCYTLVKDNNAGIVINPFSTNMMFSNDQVKHIKMQKDIKLTSHHEQVVQKETQVLIGEPTNYPQDMINAISTYAKGNKDINAIWLKLMTKDNETSFLLIVDFKGDRQNIFNGIGTAARPYLPKGMFVDMVPFADSFGKSAATGKPFYKKKSGLFSFWS